MTTALEVKHINKKYKNKVVLNDINLSSFPVLHLQYKQN